MAIRAQSADGVVHEFPDGTPMSVVNKVMASYAHSKAGQNQYAGPVSGAQMRGFALGAPASLTPEQKKLKDPNAPKAPRTKAPQYETTRSGAALRAGGRAAVPTSGAIAGAQAGTLIGAGAGLLFPPIAPATTLIGGLGGALVGGYTAHRVQQAALDANPELAAKLGQSPEQQAADVKAHPVTTFAAEVAPGLVTGRPSKKVADLLLGGGLSAGLEAASEGAYAGDVDWRKVAVAGGAGALGSKTNALGRAIHGTPASALDRILLDTRGRAGANPAGPFDSLGDLRSVGVTPSAIDVLPEAALEKVSKAAQYREPVRAASEKYARGVSAETPRAGRRAANIAVPTDPNATSTTVRTEADAAIEAAKPAIDVAPTESGRQVSERLNREYEAEHAARRAAYKEAEDAGPAYLEDLSPAAVQGEGARPNWAPVEKEGVKGFMLPTGEFKIAAEVGPANAAEVAANVRAQLNERHQLAQTAPEYKAINNVLRDVEKAKTANDLYAARRRLSDVAVEAEKSGQGAIAAAARTAKNGVDDQMRALADAGRFTDEFGYPEGSVVEKWTNAIGKGREFAKQFRGNDIIEEMTKREYAGGAEQPKLNPDAVTERLFGKGPGLVLRKESTRELEALRTRLGPDSPEWAALRGEAAARILNAPNPAKALADFEKKTPKDLVSLLVDPKERSAILGVSKAADTAATRKTAVETGEGFLTMDPGDFERALSGLDKAALRDARVAQRTAVKGALQTPRASVDYLGDLVHNDIAKANLRRLLGAQEANRFIRQAEAVVSRYARAKTVAPRSLVDEGVNIPGLALGAAAEVATHGATGGGAGAMLHGATRSVLRRLEGLGMNEEEATQLAEQLFDPAKFDESAARIQKLYGEPAWQSILRRIRAGAATVAGPARAATRVGVPAATRDVQEDQQAQGMHLEQPAGEDAAAGEIPEEPADSDMLPVDFIKQAIGAQEGTGPNPSSSATGAYQFVDSTFAQYVAKVAPDLLGADDPNTPEGAKAIAGRLRGTTLGDRPIEDVLMDTLVEDNAEALVGDGFLPTLGNLYLAHFAGAEGASNVLKADPDASVLDVLGERAVKANAGIKFGDKMFPDFTAEDLKNWARAKMNARAKQLRSQAD